MNSISYIDYENIYSGTPTLFLDRDGVINVDTGYTHKPSDFTFKPPIIETLSHWQTLGYKLIIVTNQSGIGRGYYTNDDFIRLTDWMIEQLAAHDISIASVYYCPHIPTDGCHCRKPLPGMLLHALHRYSIAPNNAWMIGDKISDVEAGRAAGIAHNYLVSQDHTNGTESVVRAVSDIILQPVI